MAKEVFVGLAEFLRERSRSVQSLSPSSAATIAAPATIAAQSAAALLLPEGECSSPPVRDSSSTSIQAASVGSPLIISASNEHPDEAAAIREGRLFRAALSDAFELLLTDLSRALADAVLGRELQLADADIANIARRLIAERHADGPVRLRIAAADARIACELPVVIDDGLQAGDAILECRSGDIDARLRVRLASVVGAVEW